MIEMPFAKGYVRVDGLVRQRLYLKLEWLNHTGSIKLKTAQSLLVNAERSGLIGPGSEIIESSSGNLGIALASLCASRRYSFTCVVDPNTPKQSCATMEAYGATVVCVREKDANDGYLSTRIDYIRHRLRQQPSLVWLNQYANPANPDAHYETTAREISLDHAVLDHVFIAAGTTGTLMGCERFFQSFRPQVRIVGVDSEGSVTFGGAAGPRWIPGMGTSRKPEIYRCTADVIRLIVPEAQAVVFCRWLARTHGVMAGGSTGSILAAVKQFETQMPPDGTIVAISPDSGERYLDTVYDDRWTAETFGLH